MERNMEKMIPGLRTLVAVEIEIRKPDHGQSATEPKLPAPVDARMAVVPSFKERKPYFVR